VCERQGYGEKEGVLVCVCVCVKESTLGTKEKWAKMCVSVCAFACVYERDSKRERKKEREKEDDRLHFKKNHSILEKKQ